MFKEGLVMGKLTLVSFHGRNKHSQKEWVCKCECGNSCIRVEGNLRTTKIPHCGCSPAWKGTNKRFKDLSGLKFGRLTVKMHYGKDKHSHNLWYCECECGGKNIVTTTGLERGSTSSCGCLKEESMKTRCITHGGTGTRLYKTYNGILARCFNKNDVNYVNYGGRGITICEGWKDFSVFKEWALSNGYKGNLTIDRIEANGNYEPNNCRWSDRITQANNKRNNLFLEHAGETKTLAEWSKELDIEYLKFYRRIKKGKTIQEVIDEFADKH